MLAYVDDVIAGRNNSAKLKGFKLFKSMLLHEIPYLVIFLGYWNCSKQKRNISLCQRRYAWDIAESGLLGCKPASFLMDENHKLALATPRVVRYLTGNLGQGVFFSYNRDLYVPAYCDSDWVRCPLTRRSLTGYFVMLGQSMVSLKKKSNIPYLDHLRVSIHGKNNLWIAMA